jgi:hypothetical protein
VQVTVRVRLPALPAASTLTDPCSPLAVAERSMPVSDERLVEPSTAPRSPLPEVVRDDEAAPSAVRVDVALVEALPVAVFTSALDSAEALPSALRVAEARREALPFSVSAAAPDSRDALPSAFLVVFDARQAAPAEPLAQRADAAVLSPSASTRAPRVTQLAFACPPTQPAATAAAPPSALAPAARALARPAASAGAAATSARAATANINDIFMGLLSVSVTLKPDRSSAGASRISANEIAGE